ncbi:MAG: 5-formyltetrahydrofolate cyclo-ligase [Pseudonocardiaceae bacterium]
MTGATEPDAKRAIRERVWDRLRRDGASSEPHGRIPDFVGAAATAQRLAALPAWHQARVIKANPDQAQLPVRARALREGKLVYMAVPKLADPLPFFRLDPAELDGEPEAMACHRTAATVAPKMAISDMRTIDLIVCGSVAVNPAGVRIGKGAGYSDIEVALLAQAGLIGPQTTIVTTVHHLQVIDEPLPREEHDFTVDYIVTTQEIIHCGPPHRPTGVVWNTLDRDKIEAIPVLTAMATEQRARKLPHSAD